MSLYRGVALEPFRPEVQEKLHRSLLPEEIEIRPDGNLYLPEIRYRRALFDAFGAGGWALVPVGPADLHDVCSC